MVQIEGMRDEGRKIAGLSIAAPDLRIDLFINFRLNIFSRNPNCRDVAEWSLIFMGTAIID